MATTLYWTAEVENTSGGLYSDFPRRDIAEEAIGDAQEHVACLTDGERSRIKAAWATQWEDDGHGQSVSTGQCRSVNLD